MKRLGILLSGRGSNFEAIADNVAAGSIDAEIAVVIANRVQARGLEVARQRGLNAVSIPSKGLDREIYDRMLVAELRRNAVDLVCLAGFMRLLSASFIREFPNRILNIHPSLLPAFPGLDAQHQALEHGVKITGCTVHFVDEDLDAGPILIQAAVPVLNDDTVEALSARILKRGTPDLFGSHPAGAGRRLSRRRPAHRSGEGGSLRRSLLKEFGKLHGRSRTCLHLPFHRPLVLPQRFEPAPRGEPAVVDSPAGSRFPRPEMRCAQPSRASARPPALEAVQHDLELNQVIGRGHKPVIGRNGSAH